MEANNPIIQGPQHMRGESLYSDAVMYSADRLLEIMRGMRDPEDALDFAQRAVRMQPDDPRVQASLLRVLEEKLRHDPFVAFLAETDDHYVITFRHSRPIVVPKARTNREIFPPLQRSEGERVLGMVWWVALGLVPVGVGAIIASPLVVRRALRVINRREAAPRDQRLAWVALLLAAALGCVGDLFVLLLVIHLAG
jgi:hypothetical protein